MKNKETSWISISIFSAKENWHLILKNGISPLLDNLSRGNKLESFNLEFSYSNGENIRLSLLFQTVQKKAVLRKIDFFLREPVARYLTNRIEFDSCSTNAHPKSDELLIIQQNLSQAMLEAFSEELIDDDMLITFATYILLCSYKYTPYRLIFSRKWSSHFKAKTEHVRGIKVNQELIKAKRDELQTHLQDIYFDILNPQIYKDFKWINTWDIWMNKLSRSDLDEEIAWQIFENLNVAISQQLGLNEFLTSLLNASVHNTLLKNYRKSEDSDNVGRYITMSVFGNYGRLGNQLFQYASLIGIAKKHHTNLILPSWDYAKYFDVEFPLGSHETDIELREFQLNYIDDWGVLNWEQGIDVIGYLQSEKYWQHCCDEIKKVLTFNLDFKNRVLEKNLNINQTSIAIHVRRGDYVNHPNFAQIPISWFFGAIRLFPDWQKCNIVIFSDDIIYCKSHFGFMSNVSFSENNSDIEDLFLMSQFNRFILSNSTFSWWGAYLSGAPGHNIVHPGFYYAGQYKEENDDKDFWPESWRVYKPENKEKIMNGNCIISTVGKTSLHNSWLNKSTKVDLHLIVYDDSYDMFKTDSPFVTKAKGHKFKLVYDYLHENPHILNQYEYFYLPDDDIQINSKNIKKLFAYMKQYNLAIAQPAIANSYYSHAHLKRLPGRKIRYTNFVEIMQPCFSRKALIKVLFTFNENQTGWGIDFHWGKILDYGQRNMAVIDDVISLHTRPVQSNHKQELEDYLKRYSLSTDIYST